MQCKEILCTPPDVKIMEFETIIGEVVSKANHYIAVPDKNGQRRIIKDDVIREYERRFTSQCHRYKDKGIHTPFTLHIKVFYADMRKDLDNSLKTVLDCLQYVGAITDDALCTKIIAEKHLSRTPRIEFAIETQQLSLCL